MFFLFCDATCAGRLRLPYGFRLMNITRPFMTFALPIIHVFIFPPFWILYSNRCYKLSILNFFLNKIENLRLKEFFFLITIFPFAHHLCQLSPFSSLVLTANCSERCANSFIRCMVCQTSRVDNAGQLPFKIVKKCFVIGVGTGGGVRPN